MHDKNGRFCTQGIGKMDLSKEERDAFALQYEKLVHKVVNSLKRQYRHVAREDFESYAWIGLLELIDRYDPNIECTFLTYAYRSLWWLTKRALNESDWHSRHIRARYGDKLPIIERWPTNIIDETFTHKHKHPRHIMELRQFVNTAIAGFSERRQSMFRAYYGDDITMGEVGKQFGITKQGVQQCIKPMIEKCKELAKEIDAAFESKEPGGDVQEDAASYIRKSPYSQMDAQQMPPAREPWDYKRVE